MGSTNGGGISYEQLHALTQPFAAYESVQPPAAQQALLARGLVEEGLEVVLGHKRFDEPGAYALAHGHAVEANELGDVWFYISELGRSNGVGAAALMGEVPDLGSWQRQDDRGILPIVSPVTGEHLCLETDPRAALAMTILRAVDVLFPKEEALWHGVGERPDLARALGDVARASMYLASRHRIDIESAIETTVQKLVARTRPAGVLTEAKQVERVSPGRQRLVHAVPWLGSAVFAEAMA